MKKLILKLLGYNECLSCGWITTKGKSVYLINPEKCEKVSIKRIWLCSNHAPYFNILVAYKKNPYFPLSNVAFALDSKLETYKNIRNIITLVKQDYFVDWKNKLGANQPKQ